MRTRWIHCEITKDWIWRGYCSGLRKIDGRWYVMGDICGPPSRASSDHATLYGAKMAAARRWSRLD